MTEGISSASIDTSYLSMIQSATTDSSTSSTSSTDDSSSSKSTSEIISELKQDGMSSTMTAQDIADEYGISLAKAQEILEELKGDDETQITSQGFTIDPEIPDDSTVSYYV
jgi:hypothetical protein